MRSEKGVVLQIASDSLSEIGAGDGTRAAHRARASVSMARSMKAGARRKSSKGDGDGAEAVRVDSLG